MVEVGLWFDNVMMRFVAVLLIYGEHILGDSAIIFS